MAELNKPPVAISLAELTVLAIDDRQRRYDWSWLMCFYVREWEKGLIGAFREQGEEPINSHFGWFHYQEICDRTLAGAERRIDEVKRLIQSNDNARLSRYGEFLLHGILIPECAREFRLLLRAAADHGLRTSIPSPKGGD